MDNFVEPAERSLVVQKYNTSNNYRQATLKFKSEVAVLNIKA